MPIFAHMMILRRSLLLIALVGIGHGVAAQDTLVPEVIAWRDSLDAYWMRMDAEYADSATSPLKAEDRAHFMHLSRFAPDSGYCVQARFTAVKDAEAFVMQTSTDRLPRFRTYGTLLFTLNGSEYMLSVYEDAVPDPRYPGYLFLPFTDLTNGEQTYGAGRYLDLKAPLAETVLLDFNKAYNPYCAYNDKYSCPIPPSENHLSTAVKAGVLKFHD
jgi:uncharacterized protein (DUF1684 family)